MAAGASATEPVSPTTEAVAVGTIDSDGSVYPALGLCGEGAVVSRSVNTLESCALISRALAIAASAAEGTNSGELSFVGSRGVLPVAPFFLGSGCTPHLITWTCLQYPKQASFFK
jgi:hypothetical protein